MQAVEIEARRQVDLIESGGTVVQETRLFDPGTGTTRSMRSKEDAHDYRYFPDPDLLPVEFDDAFVAECRGSLPELPDAKRARYEAALGPDALSGRVLTAEKETSRLVRNAGRGLCEGTGQERSRCCARGRQLGDGRSVRRAEAAGAGASKPTVSPDAKGPSCWRCGRWHAVGAAGEAGVRGMLETGEARRHCRGARAEAGQRHRRHRCGDRRYSGGQCRQGGAVQGRQGQRCSASSSARR
jgi:aspartyl-tRNA(Asn)/glutamyl-tRNA(Gln) amidotransferase subunit B